MAKKPSINKTATSKTASKNPTQLATSTAKSPTKKFFLN